MESQVIGLIVLAVLIAGFVYFIPSFMAYRRQHRNRLAILAMNLFLGWTFLGWVGALVWSLTDRRRPTQ